MVMWIVGGAGLGVGSGRLGVTAFFCQRVFTEAATASAITTSQTVLRSAKGCPIYTRSKFKHPDPHEN